MGIEVLRTADERFTDVPDYDYAPHYHEWTEPGGTVLRTHFVDEGSGPPVLMLHGQPQWGWQYHALVRPLVAAGYRCIIPDHVGFGRSDKVVDDGWYVIERHCEALRSLIEALNLQNVRVVVHDWGGPIGLRQVVDMPARFSHLFILNTWLHHVEMQYSPAIRAYHTRMTEIPPQTGDVWQQAATGQGDTPQARAIRAPFPDPRYMAGPRRFPLLHPYADPIGGNAAEQARCFAYLRTWPKPAHVIWSRSDPIFRPEWGHRWAMSFPFGTFDLIGDERTGHFLQLTQAPAIVALMLNYMK